MEERCRFDKIRFGQVDVAPHIAAVRAPWFAREAKTIHMGEG
jgi:hypothetical protein